jgi:DNA adenine methylase
MGGKARLAAKLLPLFPEHTTYVEPFCGAANLLFAKPRSQVEVLNDLDDELVNLLRTIKTKTKPLIRTAAAIPYSRVWYERLQQEQKAGGLKGSHVQRAAKFWFLIRASFFGHPEKGWRFAITTREGGSRFDNGLHELEAVAERLHGVYIDHLDFRRCIKNWDSPATFFSVDPPYYGATAYRRCVKAFTVKDHEDLAKILAKVEGKWLLTYNDHPRVRELYAGHKFKHLSNPMNTNIMAMGQTRPRQRQLVISNYDTKR